MQNVEYYKPSGKFNLFSNFGVLFINILISVFLGYTLFFLNSIGYYYYFLTPILLAAGCYFCLRKSFFFAKCRNPFLSCIIGLIVGLTYYFSFLIFRYSNYNVDSTFPSFSNFMNYLIDYFNINKDFSLENFSEGVFSDLIFMSIDFLLTLFLLAFGAFDISKTPFDEYKNCWLYETKLYYPEGYASEIYEAVQTGNWKTIDLLDRISKPNEAYDSFVKVQLYGNPDHSDLAYICISEKKGSHILKKTQKTQIISMKTYKKLIESN